MVLHTLGFWPGYGPGLRLTCEIELLEIYGKLQSDQNGTQFQTKEKPQWHTYLLVHGSIRNMMMRTNFRRMSYA